MIVFQLNVILIYIVPVKFDWQRIRRCKVSRRKFEAIDLFLRSILTEFHIKQIRELGWQSHLIKQRMCGFWIRTTLSAWKVSISGDNRAQQWECKIKFLLHKTVNLFFILELRKWFHYYLLPERNCFIVWYIKGSAKLQDWWIWIRINHNFKSQ